LSFRWERIRNVGRGKREWKGAKASLPVRRSRWDYGAGKVLDDVGEVFVRRLLLISRVVRTIPLSLVYLLNMAFRRDDAWNLWFRIEITISFGKQCNSYPAICPYVTYNYKFWRAIREFYATLIIADFREELHIHSNVLAYN